MSAYHYTAYDAQGAAKKGVLVADGEAHAMSLLRQRGLFPERVEPARSGKSSSGFALTARRLSDEDRAVLTRQLAVLIGAELPVDEALGVLMQSDMGGTVRRVAAQLQARVRDGLSLSRAMESEKASFPDFFIAAISAGEQSGELGQVLETLADYVETRQSLRESTATALVYPVFVALVSLVVAAILLTTVAPELVALFEQTGQELPAITKISVALGDLLARYWPLVIAGLVGTAIGIKFLLKVDRVYRAYDGVLLRLPVLGRLRRLEAGALYLRTLALVLASRLPADRAMRFAIEAVKSPRLRAEAQAAHTLVEGGRRLATGLRQMSAVPPIAFQLIESGEKSGRLPLMADRAAGAVETTLSSLRQRLSALMEPIMMMLVGSMVLIIVLSVMLPIFDLQTGFTP